MNDNGLTRKETKMYGFLSIVIIFSVLVFICSCIAFVIVMIKSFIYWFNNDSLTIMQVFKYYLKPYLITFGLSIVSSIIMKSSYNSWKVLDDKSNEYKNRIRIVK